MSFRAARTGGALAILVGAVALAAPAAAAHPPEQHIAQRASYVSPVQQLRSMLAVGGLLPEARIGDSCGDDGMALIYPCENVDLESFLPLPLLGGVTGNDIWGWTDPQTGREYALIGTSTSTGFVDVTAPKDPMLVGVLPTAANPAPDFVLWRDIKVYKDHAFIVSEISGSGMQVFDLTRLRDESGILTEDAFYDKVSNTHNIAINEETGYAYLVGSTVGGPPDEEICEADGNGTAAVEGGGLHMVDIRDPLNPTFAGCALHQGVDPDTGDSNNYVHDAHCIVYDGPDSDYTGREICVGSNENAVVIYDVTDKANPVVVSETTYPTDAYTHQGWLTEDRKYFLFGDELDEGVASSGTPPGGGNVPNTTTYIMPVDDLDDPGEVKAYMHESNTIDHNMYVHGNHVYQSNYQEGLRILEFDNASLGAGELTEVAFFDVLPGADTNDFAGSWSNYRFPGSGTTVISAIEEQQNGIFVLKPTVSPDFGSGGGGSGGGSGEDGGSGQGAGDQEVPGPAEGPCANELIGGKGSQQLKGTKGSDRIAGKGGRDRLKGRGGDDCIRGGGGKDRIKGGGGDDEIRPGRGKDRIKGGGGDDEIRAARGGRDRVNCGSGDDVAFAHAKKDRVARNCETVKT
ncbi:MAG: choice-of-anchor B family protein [Solirubrobacterales bacterium]